MLAVICSSNSASSRISVEMPPLIAPTTRILRVRRGYRCHGCLDAVLFEVVGRLVVDRQLLDDGKCYARSHLALAVG